MLDFFISYTNADVQWARWIAWQFEGAGYQVFIQDWDIRPGHNFIVEMQRAAEQAERTVAVLSPDYLASSFALPEWAAAVAQDPTGSEGTLLPIRVHVVELRGLLRAIVYIDLVGLSEEDARDALLDGVRRVRHKATEAPAFPGKRAVPVDTPIYPVAAPAERDPFRDWTFVDVKTTDEGDLAFLFRPASSRTVVGMSANLTPDQAGGLDRRVAMAQNAVTSTDKIRESLATLLVPGDLRKPIGEATRLCFAADKGASRYPWELLYAPTEAAVDDDRASVTTTVLRTLPATYPVRAVPTNRQTGALVIGSPMLPWANSEAGLVEHILSRGNGHVSVVISEDPAKVLSALYRRRYDIVHIVGRGRFHSEDRRIAGVQLLNDLLITRGEIAALESPPAFVFLNIGKVSGPTGAAQPLHHGELATQLAEGFLQEGVSCVIATGWAVGEREASAFVGEFYSQMRDGAAFDHSVERARHATYRLAPFTNAWGGFFCYGRPDFVLSS